MLNKTYTTITHSSHTTKLRLYQKFGYKKVAKLKNYYGNAHGIYLKKDLT
jgi:ribosomal protein S18 acetylase RimI-like enzyme